MAGQPEKMQQLMQRNPGLHARFQSKQVFLQMLPEEEEEDGNEDVCPLLHRIVPRRYDD
jgi:hypothetical protein